MNRTQFYNLIKPVVFIFLFIQIPIQYAYSDSPLKEKDNFRFLEMDIAQLQQGYKEGKFTIREVVQAYKDRIDDIDMNGPGLHSIIRLNHDAIRIAQSLDNELSHTKIIRGPLFGIPVVIKDNIDTHDSMPCTAGSRALMDSYPLKDSYVVKQLRAAGAIIIAKSNLSEWANFRGQLSTSGWSGLGGQTKNPYILSRNPCGSSSGSAVAVSANLTAIAIGTETDGSIVCPSQTNGIVGIKPTVGLISRGGVIPISSTQDTPGPMGRTVRDVAVCLGALTGVDSADVKTLASPGHIYRDYTQFLKNDGLKGKRIGLFKAPYGINYKVDSLTNRAVAFLKSRGAVIIEIPEITNAKVDKMENEIMLYEYKDGLNSYFRSLGPKAPIKNIDELIAFNKTDSIELRYFNQHYLEQAREKGDLNSPEYKTALADLKKGSQEDGIDKVMNENKLDAIMAPTGSPAWKTDLTNGDSFQIGTSSPAAQAGYPDITVPMGFIDDLPVGISFFGRAWSEPVLLEIAYAYEQGTMYRKAPEFLKED
jgi:amidase